MTKGALRPGIFWEAPELALTEGIDEDAAPQQENGDPESVAHH